MRTTDEMIEVMQAFNEGKTIECRGKKLGAWYVVDHPNWNWEECNYRIRPEPREVFLAEYAHSNFGAQYFMSATACLTAYPDCKRVIRFVEDKEYKRENNG